MLIELMGAWMMAVTWSIMVRKVLDFDAGHPLNWGGACLAFVTFLLLTKLFSESS